jgi:hypothetical protein
MVAMFVVITGATMDCAAIDSAAKSNSEPKITKNKPIHQRLNNR